MRPARRALGVGVAMSVAAACDSLCDDCDVPIGACAVGTERFYPMEPGAWWRHHVVNPLDNIPDCPDKLVSIRTTGPIRSEAREDGVLLRGDVEGTLAFSEREGSTGFRWHEVADDGDYRLLDEWFHRDALGELGERSKVDFYCPRALHTPEGPRSCVDMRWTERYVQVTMTLPLDGTGDWSDCLSILVDPQTCEPSEVRPGCVIKRRKHTVEWSIGAVDVPTETPDGEAPAMQITQVDKVSVEPGEDPEGDEVQTQWWARGLGKLRESKEPVELETLLDYCLPSQGCTRPTEPFEHLTAACPSAAPAN